MLVNTSTQSNIKDLIDDYINRLKLFQINNNNNNNNINNMTEDLSLTVEAELDKFVLPIKGAFKEIRERLDNEEAKLLELYTKIRKSVKQKTSKKADKIEQLTETKIEIEQSLTNSELEEMKQGLIENIDGEIKSILEFEEDEDITDEEDTLRFVTEEISKFHESLKNSQCEINKVMNNTLISDKQNSVKKQSEKLVPKFVKLSSSKNEKYKLFHKLLGADSIDLEEIRKIYSNEIHIEPSMQFGKKGDKPGEMNGPLGITVHKNYKIYVADCHNGQIQVFTIRGKFLHQFGKGLFIRPHSVVLANHFIFVSDYELNTVFKFEKTHFKMVTRTDAGQLDQPNGMSTDGGDIYVADSQHDRVVVYNTDLKLLREIGNGQLKKPCDVKIRDEKIYIVDNGKPHNVHIYLKSGDPLKSMITLEGETFWNFLTFDMLGNLIISDNTTQHFYIYTKKGELVYDKLFDYRPTGVAINSNDNSIIWADVNNCVINFYNPL